MPRDDPRVEVIEQYLATRRRIKEIERKGLAKLGAPAPSGPTCSFCGWSAYDVLVIIEGPNNARICSECIEKISGMLKGDDDK
jgi:ClpX C4-type zinc finger protein